MQNPEKGKTIKNSGGIRKIRMAIKSGGKSGGARVFYFYVRENNEIFMLYVLEKADSADLTAQQLQRLRRLIEE
jgi:hypothetical protein